MTKLSKHQCPSKWDLRFLELAKLVATWSKDEKHKVGAVLVNIHNHVIGLGYNGTPRGIEEALPDKSNVIHAELNAVLNSTMSLDGATIYVHPFMPCAHCTALLINRGIKRVVCNTTELSLKWQPEAALNMFAQAGVTVDVVENDSQLNYV